MKQASQYIREQLAGSYSDREITQLISRVICHVCHLQSYQFLSDKDIQLSANERRQVEEIVKRLLQQEPIQYIFGETEFFGLPFAVDNRVLIPRPETEELVEWVIENEEKSSKNEVFDWLNILDVGTGSGCIAVTLAKYLPEAKVYGMDISGEAIQVADANANSNEVQVAWIEGDALEDEAWTKIPDGLDVIISNPPYVTIGEKAGMEKNVLAYEPHTALFVPEMKPLLFYERIAEMATRKLKTGGCIYFEINANYGPEVCNMLQQKGYITIELRKDISGNDRMIKASL